MATTSIYVQMKGGRPPRIITATSLAWKFGRLTTITALYQKTAGTVVTVNTFMHRIESDPDPTAGAFPTVPSAAPTTDITVAQQQLAIEAAPASSADLSCLQLSPYVPTTSTAVTTSVAGGGRVLAAPAQLQKILNTSFFDYIRFTGTELPTGGIIINRDEMVCMFSYDATTPPSDL